ncbi:MAG TPA: DUF4381 domain-containing protein [Rhodanobacteraceae bacterium]|jgi:hypothetical protein|nr:DUF4381 domain-containing protein [Rhodanobacteraceae bacterium]
MNANGPTLRDIHVPTVSWWPPAVGWWLLAAVLLIAIVACVLLVLRYRRLLHPRRAARHRLDTLAMRFAQDGDTHALAAGVSKLLRRIALMVEPAAAARDSTDWRAFLSRRVPGAFDDAQLATLLEAPYRAQPEFDGEALLASARSWCERALRKGVRTPA